MKKNIWKAAVLSLLAVLIMSGCATTVRVQTEQMPALDTSGIRRIAIMPFGTGANTGRLHREMSQYITSVATRQIQQIGHFTLVSPAEIDRLLRNNQSIEGHVDALFSGQISYINVNERSFLEQRRTRDGRVYSVTVFIREADIGFNYYFSRARDGSIIGPVFKRGSASSRGDSSAQLRTAEQLLRGIVDDQLRLLHREIAPHTVTETRRIARGPSGDRLLRSEMNIAHAQVRAGDYRAAINTYLDIFQRHGNITAVLNASFLLEALGDVRAAANLLSAVLAETGSAEVRDALDRQNRILLNQAAVAREFGQTLTGAERVAAHASDEVRRVLPHGARLYIINNAVNDRSLAYDVIDNMSSIFIRSGVNLVERQNIDLILAEKNLQFSGFVSDADIMSIGNLAGANTAVIVSMTGTGAARRLQLRVLDLERGVPVFISDTGEAWRL